MSRHFKVRFNAHTGLTICLLVLLVLGGQPASFVLAQPLEGEFTDIELGRELVETDHFPTIAELREAVRRPEIRSVLLFKLHGDQDNHHLPVWSPDGQRLAFQRSKLGVNSSKLLIYESLGQSKPKLVTPDDVTYDYMLRWGINAASSFIFVRIEGRAQASRLYYSDGAADPVPLKTAAGTSHPTLYEASDGTRQIAFEHEGEVLHLLWTGETGPQRTISRGTSPRWSRDGQRLLFAKTTSRPGNVAAYRITEREIFSEREQTFDAPQNSVLRSPTYSPNGTRVAWFERDANERSPWRIQVCELNASAKPASIMNDVVMNPDFKTEGPSWEPSGKRIWCFSHAQRQEQFFPLLAVNVETGSNQIVRYPASVTTPFDVAVNPATAIPEIAFVGHHGVAQDLFILFLNHY